MAQRTFIISNEIQHIEFLYEQIELLGEEWEWSPKIIMQMNLVVEEIVSNIILYGFRDNTEHTIEIQIEYEDGVITLITSDDGIPFDPLSVKQPDLDVPVEDRKIGGLGIHFVHEIMDEVTYERGDDHNILTMVKKTAG
jgi:serine/threonine-protein kinase RsbW